MAIYSTSFTEREFQTLCTVVDFCYDNWEESQPLDIAVLRRLQILFNSMKQEVPSDKVSHETKEQ